MIEPVKQLELFPTADDMQVGGDHYMDKAIQPWDYIVKYISRWKDKGGVDDLRKAQHYLAKLIEVADEKA